ncbi:MAG: Methyltransferase type 11 [Flavipsychrobacter sp.]|jgi:hypothetical protein|nr:Methyltransferase type 11 [Flavipsychrobacter sp.]
MISARIRNLQEFIALREDNAHVYKRISQIEEDLCRQELISFKVKGFSYPAQSEVNFKVQITDGKVNWRESVICPKTKLNSRIRAAVHYIDFELNAQPESKIYIAEQLTPLYKFLKKKFPNLIGSEYLGPLCEPGFISSKNVRHEDAKNLSFKDGEMDYYLSFECFEHIPDYTKCFSECHRVLRQGGVMMWSVPFAHYNHENIMRATMSADGSIVHHMEPEYHGDPTVPGKGILCYTHFGWQMLEQVKNAGFRDAFAITYWSDALGYYDGNQILFCAVK